MRELWSLPLRKTGRLLSANPSRPGCPAPYRKSPQAAGNEGVVDGSHKQFTPRNRVVDTSCVQRVKDRHMVLRERVRTAIGYGAEH